MDEKKYCKIVQDLLPNYVENLTDTETNRFIEEHLKNCDECQTTLENMKKNIEISNKHKENKEINYMKKLKNKMSILEVIVLGVLLFLLFLLGQRVFLILKISNLVEKAENISNYSAKRCIYYVDKVNIADFYSDSYVGNSIRVYETIYKEGSYIVKLVDYSENNIQKIVTYKNIEDNEALLLSNTSRGKVFRKFDDMTMADTMVKITPTNNIINLKCTSLLDFKRILSAIKDIDIIDFSGQKCYQIELWNGNQVVINKNTGLPVREILSNVGTTNISEFYYIINNVTDEDIVKPNLDEYTELVD